MKQTDKTAHAPARGRTTPVGLVCAPSDMRAVEAIVERSGTSFGKGMRILPPLRREGLFAIYAFCRLVDDIADGDTDDKDPKAALELWSRRLDRLYKVPTQADGESQDGASSAPLSPPTPLERVLEAAIERFHLKRADFQAIIDGMAMDCGTPIVAPDEETLDLYCDRVASAVGRLAVRVFGTPQPQGDELAHHLGRALQLTNILRDISEDASRGRIYLPAKLLKRFKVPAQPSELPYAPGLDGVCRIMAQRARDHYRAAKRIMKQCPPYSVRPSRLMAASYEVVLDALEKRGWRNPDIALRPNPWRKKLRLLMAGLGL
ncbi:presqualene diphosphate synthase HpnD [Formicincola oecophyllae]|uniref:Presqualene diphosphate synthase HpnD n=1 Tax=Formicincola oecophyllae TaxID=2558361 RepID=A0A4Y6UBV0_9PROT|nr:presqualene diphosphate synthase HpnD [Formicincola oecophyllae]QDH13956.1 presqualene diphosphate synthase HpnD [Formicincola oecophyllae]